MEFVIEKGSISVDWSMYLSVDYGGFKDYGFPNFVRFITDPKSHLVIIATQWAEPKIWSVTHGNKTTIRHDGASDAVLDRIQAQISNNADGVQSLWILYNLVGDVAGMQYVVEGKYPSVDKDILFRYEQLVEYANALGMNTVPTSTDGPLKDHYLTLVESLLKDKKAYVVIDNRVFKMVEKDVVYIALSTLSKNVTKMVEGIRDGSASAEKKFWLYLYTTNWPLFSLLSEQRFEMPGSVSHIATFNSIYGGL